MEQLRNTFLSILFFTFQLEISHGFFQSIFNPASCRGSMELLTSVMISISNHTRTPLIALNVSNIDAVSENLSSLVNQTTACNRSEGNGTMSMFETNCKLCDDNKLTVKAWKGVPSYLSLAVHDGNMATINPQQSIHTFCDAYLNLTCPNIKEDKCDVNICEAYFETFQIRICDSLDKYCSNTTTREDTTPCHSYYGSKDNASQSEGADILPIVIASIASFIAGVIVCLLVLCLHRHRRERPCFKSATSEDGSSKPKQETHEGLQGQSNRRNIPEYLGLQDVNPESRTELGAKRPSAPQQAIVNETSDKRRSEHVYSELGDKPTNGPGEYESTYPNRSSNHVYQGIQSNTNPDIPSRHQTNELPENKRGNKGHINGAMEQDRDPISETDGADGCYSQKHDYFVLEKETHKPNESGMSAGTKSDGQGRLNDSLQSEPDDNYTQPNDYFVLEKENKAVNEGERVEDIKIDDTHLEADDDIDDDCHSYHVLEKQ